VRAKPAFERVRKLCLSLPDTSEKLSHGEPTFFVRKRVFVMFSTNHHGDGNYAIVCNAPIFGVRRLAAALKAAPRRRTPNHRATIG